MKKNSLADYLLYYLVKALSFLFRLIPVSLALLIARRLGVISMYFSSKRRGIAYANLKSAFSGRYTPKELKAILKKAYANIGQGLIEVFLLPKIDEAYLKQYISFEDFHFADEAFKRGKGLIFLTAHFGNWEVGNVALPLKGFSFKVIAREQKPYLLNKLLNRYRQSKGCKVLSKGLAILSLRAISAENPEKTNSLTQSHATTKAHSISPVEIIMAALAIAAVEDAQAAETRTPEFSLTLVSFSTLVSKFLILLLSEFSFPPKTSFSSKSISPVVVDKNNRESPGTIGIREEKSLFNICMIRESSKPGSSSFIMPALSEIKFSVLIRLILSIAVFPLSKLFQQDSSPRP